eukprot:g3159.t1
MRIPKKYLFYGSFAYFGGVGITYWLTKRSREQQNVEKTQGHRDDACNCHPVVATSLTDVTEKTRLDAYRDRASTFDRDIGMDETMMGITILRRLLMRNAQGPRVLEVGAGTSRNLDYLLSSWYSPDPSSLKEIVLTDAVPAMLTEVEQKHCSQGSRTDSKSEVEQPKPNRRENISIPLVRTECCPAEDLSTFPNDHFDTVIDTFGLCSYEDPVKALTEMRRVCKPGGKLLLLEHGRSYYDWLNSMLDDSAVQHAIKWGCVWNKDIGKILIDAGFDKSSISRFHFGTTYYVVETKA